MHPPVRPSVCPSVRAFTCQPTPHPSARSSICSSAHLPLIHPSPYPSIIQLSIHLPMHPSTHVCPSICPVLIEHLPCSGSCCRALLTAKSYPHLPESYQGWRWGKTDQRSTGSLPIRSHPEPPLETRLVPCLGRGKHIALESEAWVRILSPPLTSYGT